MEILLYLVMFLFLGKAGLVLMKKWDAFLDNNYVRNEMFSDSGQNLSSEAEKDSCIEISNIHPGDE